MNADARVGRGANDPAFIERLWALASHDAGDRIRISAVMAALGDRAIAGLLLLFALPNAVPAVPGTSALLGLPLLLLAGQLALGKRAWLPAWIARRDVATADLRASLRRLSGWLEWAGPSLRPRWQRLSGPPALRPIGAVCVVLALVLMLPIPLGNMPPALAIAVMSIGILWRDGIWVSVGLAAACAALALASGVVWALARGALAALAQFGT